MFKNISFNQQDTIVACATGEGVAALGIVRMSGINSWIILQQIFVQKRSQVPQANVVRFGKIIQNKKIIDEVLVSTFEAPHSFTGEDCVEITCHGSPLIIEQIIAACMNAGARLAKAGEFTQRAFFNGKIDLTQAEAVADLIHAQNVAGHDNAIKNLRGGFSLQLQNIKQQLIAFSALTELELDFSEEDVAFADRSDFIIRLQNMQQEVNVLLNSFAWGNAIKNGISIAIIGKPNAGKSTLLNAIVNEERAIVSTIAGTTRDAIEECVQYKNISFRFIDTAGIRQTNDEIEQIGVAKAYEKMGQANMILYLFDATTMTQCELIEQEDFFKNKNFSYLLLANKIDQLSPEQIQKKFKSIPHYFLLSAKNKSGVDSILEHIYQHFVQQNTGSVIVSNRRHYEALKNIEDNLLLIKNGIEQNLSGDLLSVEIKQCLHYIGELTGEVTNEHILDDIFSKFCIGK